MKTVDMHCDTLNVLMTARRNGVTKNLFDHEGQLSLKKMQAGDYLLQNFAMYVDMGSEPDPTKAALEMADIFYQEMEKNSDIIRPVRCYKDIEENVSKGLISAMLTIEEGEICQGNLALLRDFYRLGVRMMTLTWNYKNQLGWPNAKHADGSVHPDPDPSHGLTEKGIEFLEEMEQIGMIPDISHLNDTGIWDVFKYTKKPFVASHSNARALASHPRNLTDEMIKALAKRGGVAGINYYSLFLNNWSPDETPLSLTKDMVRHIKHMKNIGGIECIGLGSDFDGMDGHLEITGPQDISLLADEMHRQGFTESEIDKVFGENVLRVYREILR